MEIEKLATEFKTRTENEVLEFAKELSLQTGEVVTFSGIFGKITFQTHKNLSSVPVEQPATRHMLSTHQGFVKGGKVVRPTKGFSNRQAATEARTGRQ